MNPLDPDHITGVVGWRRCLGGIPAECPLPGDGVLRGLRPERPEAEAGHRLRGLYRPLGVPVGQARGGLRDPPGHHRGRDAGQVFLAWHWSRGRGYRDFRPGRHRLRPSPRGADPPRPGDPHRGGPVMRKAMEEAIASGLNEYERKLDRRLVEELVESAIRPWRRGRGRPRPGAPRAGIVRGRVAPPPPVLRRLFESIRRLVDDELESVFSLRKRFSDYAKAYSRAPGIGGKAAADPRLRPGPRAPRGSSSARTGRRSRAGSATTRSPRGACGRSSSPRGR